MFILDVDGVEMKYTNLKIDMLEELLKCNIKSLDDGYYKDVRLKYIYIEYIADDVEELSFELYHFTKDIKKFATIPTEIYENLSSEFDIALKSPLDICGEINDWDLDTNYKKCPICGFYHEKDGVCDLCKFFAKVGFKIEKNEELAENYI